MGKKIQFPDGLEKYFLFSENNGIVKIKRNTLISKIGPVAFFLIIIIYTAYTYMTDDMATSDIIVILLLTAGGFLYLYLARPLVFDLNNRKINRRGGINFDDISGFTIEGSVMNHPASGQNKSVYAIHAEIKNSDKTVNLIDVPEKSTHNTITNFFNRLIKMKY